MSSAAPALKRLARPPFPSGWASLPLTPANLTLANTLPVGQSFLWHRHALPSSSSSSSSSPSPSPSSPREEFARAITNPPRVVCLRQTDTELYYTAIYPDGTHKWDEDQKAGTTRRWLEDYFQLKQYPDLEELYASWRVRDPQFFGAVPLHSRAVGVRVLRQDPWECLIAFITSANNNISRITSLLHKLCAHFSPPLLSLENPDGGASTTYYPFPAAESFPTEGLEPLLREMGFGYRAGYLASSLAHLRARAPGSVEAELLRWRTLPLDELRAELLQLKGVGRKVADCVMLMCMDQESLVPIDTHIYAIATRHPALPARLRKPKFATALYDPVQAFLAERWGPLGGWCQAVVFAAELERRAGTGSAEKAGKKVVTEVEAVAVVERIQELKTEIEAAREVFRRVCEETKEGINADFEAAQVSFKEEVRMIVEERVKDGEDTGDMSPVKRAASIAPSRRSSKRTRR